MDEIINCVIQACCGPEERVLALTKWMSEYMPAEHAAVAAQHILKHFDLAPAGTLTPLVQEIARLARGENYKP